MHFYQKLEEMGVQDILNPVEYKSPYFYNWEAVDTFLDEIIQSSLQKKPKKILIYGDYDVDGAMCAKIMQEGLTSLGVNPPDVYYYKERTHLLDKRAVQKCILGKYDYFIVCDAGSSDLELLRKITMIGTKVILLDHHISSYNYADYDDNIAIINTMIENDLLQEDDSEFEKFELSAAALCYCVIRKFSEEHQLEFNNSIVAYATISLFSDCMNMKNSRNRSIYFESMKLTRSELPELVLLFMNEYSAFNARYIGFWFSPRINALFRSENFDILNDLLFKNQTIAQLQANKEMIEEVYEQIRNLVNQVTDIIYVEELEHFVIGELNSVDKYINVKDNKLQNYTGLVANRLSDRYGKTAVVCCHTGSSIKGSLRDIFSRNYLSLFQQFCTAQGHPPAFGLNVNPFDYDYFIETVHHIDSHFSINKIENEPIIINVPYNTPDSGLIEDIAKYNEFSGQSLPVIYLRKQILGGMKEFKTPYNYKYRWGDYYIQSDRQLNFGVFVLIKPIKSVKTKLLVQ